MIRLLRTHEIDARLLQEWSSICASDARFTSPYFAPAFTEAVAAVRNDVYVAVLERQQGVGGFFPFQKHGRVGRPVGGVLSDFQAVVASTELEWCVADLMHACGITVLEFDHMLAHQAQYAPYHLAIDESPYMDLSRGMEAYATEIRGDGSAILQQTARKERKLAREVGALRFEFHSADDSAFRQLLIWKGRQFTGSGNSDIFSAPWTRNLLEHIRHTDTTQFAGVFSTLHAGDQLVAAHFGMRTAEVLHYWFPVYNEAFKPYSPGIILLLKLAEYAAKLNVHRIDLGKGPERYKQQLKSGGIAVAEGYVELPGLAAYKRQALRGLESVVRQSPLFKIARVPGRILRQIGKRRRLQ